MRLLSGSCSCCGKRRSIALADLLLCPDCDTAPSKLPGSDARGAPPHMPGAVNGYTVPENPTTPEERS